MSVLTTDSRGRATLGAKSTTYKVTEFDGGALLLEPARHYTEAEVAILSTPGAAERISESMRRPMEGQKAKRRTRA